MKRSVSLHTRYKYTLRVYAYKMRFDTSPDFRLAMFTSAKLYKLRGTVCFSDILRWFGYWDVEIRQFIINLMKGLLYYKMELN